MVRDISFGQYYPAKSFVHNMDPRSKLACVVMFITAVFICDKPEHFLLIGSFILLVILFSKVPLKSVLKSIKGIMFLVTFTAVLNLFFYKEGRIIFELGPLRLTYEGAIFSLTMAIRLITLVMGTTLLTLTTTPMALTDGLESILSPFKKILPVHDIAIIMSITLRFIPSLMGEIDRIMMAQKARGASFDQGGLVKRAKALLPVLIPLFVSSFSLADELALALEARCYSATPNRTKYKKLTLSYRDAVGVVACGALIAGVAIVKSLGLL